MANSDGLKYDVTIRQQPLHARISAMKISDRRPVDPPVVVQLSVTDLQDTGTGPPAARAPHRKLPQHSHLTNPYYFMMAFLVEPSNDIEVKFASDGGRPSTSGALVSSLRVLKDYPNSEQDAAFFIFPDICVRLEGSWRFKLSLFVVQDEKVKWCTTTYSAPFFVYRGKEYPGVQISTPLTRALAAQGVKLRIRKEIREKAPDVHAKEEYPLTGDASFVSSESNLLKSPKRRRTLVGPPGSLESPPLFEMSNALPVPRQSLSPTPPGFYGPSKMQHESRFRRASLDAPAVQRPHPTRDWASPMALDYPTNSSPSMSSKSDPSFLQWGFLRPAHPSPESHHAVGTPYPGLVRHMSSTESDRCAPNTGSMYSWAPSAAGRDAFSPPSVPDTAHRQFSLPAPAFWQIDAAQRGNFENANTEPLGWTAYGASAH